VERIWAMWPLGSIATHLKCFGPPKSNYKSLNFNHYIYIIWRDIQWLFSLCVPVNSSIFVHYTPIVYHKNSWENNHIFHLKSHVVSPKVEWDGWFWRVEKIESSLWSLLDFFFSSKVSDKESCRESDALKHPSVGNTGPYTASVLYICCMYSLFCCF